MYVDGFKELQQELHRLIKANKRLPKGDDFIAWQKWAIQKMRQGWSIPAKRKAKPSAKIIECCQRDGYELQKLLIQGRSGNIPGCLLIPDSALKNKMPAALCIHGNVPGGALEVAGEDHAPHIKDALDIYHDDYARKLAQRGIITLVIDQPLQGARQPASTKPQAAETFDAAILAMIAIGQPYLGQCLTDQQIALDYLRSRPEVDRKRVGAIGFSMGATLSAALAAIDKRLKCVLFSGYVTSWRERMAKDQSPQSLITYAPVLQWFDMPDILAMAAPAPLIIIAESRDAAADETRWLKPVRNAYRQLEAAKKLKIWRPPVGPHKFHPTPSLEMFTKSLIID